MGWGDNATVQRSRLMHMLNLRVDHTGRNLQITMEKTAIMAAQLAGP